MSRSLFAAALIALSTSVAPALAQNMVGPWPLYDTNANYFSDLYYDQDASNNKYVAYHSVRDDIWLYIQAEFLMARPGTGPWRGYWVSYSPYLQPCDHLPPAIDDLRQEVYVWGYLEAFALPDGRNVSFSGSTCDGPMQLWASTFE